MRDEERRSNMDQDAYMDEEEEGEQDLYGDLDDDSYGFEENEAD